MLEAKNFNTTARRAASRAKQLGLTQKSISIAIGVSQSQVSRVLSGTSKRRSKIFDSVCKYVFSYGKSYALKPQSCPELMAAIGEVWDGTPLHASALAAVIRSLGLLHSTETRREI